jgi:hypothetical protein
MVAWWRYALLLLLGRFVVKHLLEVLLRLLGHVR